MLLGQFMSSEQPPLPCAEAAPAISSAAPMQTNPPSACHAARMGDFNSSFIGLIWFITFR
jgi:hypothetical protein